MSHRKDGVVIYEILGRLWGGCGSEELSIGHVKSEMLVGHPNGGVRKTSVEFRE